METSYTVTALVIIAYLLAGFVKGVIGMGLPTVALGLLAAVISPAQAAAILIAPSLATNIWQMVAGPYLVGLVKRLGGMLLGMFVGAWLGNGILTGANAKPAAIGLGIVLIAYSLIGLSKVKFSVPRASEIWVGPLVGIGTGAVMAATGVFVIPALPYLQAMGFDKDELVQALGLHFTVSTVALALVLWDGGAFSLSLGTLSLFAIAPAVIGMYAGQRVRARLSPETFRIFLYIGLLALGALQVARNVL
ncbi:sulfite exporter TauE/SafE family protein [Pseudorhodoplanes sp.]|uniref:sulfite exporter TauE/SafE family protein n=1 Tax=Pseudorhodoplanes sp. TaxID=1934341 RepID=UPI002C0639CA|nr:sulfite exporter TauE/SafE family protein [Pseudorhodoplanes sp.]HWV51421.1 sulfite exporter TauE/SafE family protein [Pseudorhodoplanes sp.]